MAVTPGTSSGTYDFLLTNGSVVVEAFDRINIRPAEIGRHMMLSARTSLNLEMIEWEDAGFLFWKTTSGTINLAVNQATYTLPASLVTIEEVYYSNVNGGGAGVNQDRIMMPITRTDYAALTNKLQQGIPTQYWYQMLSPPRITIWEVPFVGAPNYVINWYGLQQVQDANLGGGETPDVPRRAYDALCAGMAKRLAMKFKPELYELRKADAEEAFNAMARRDQEPGPISFLPNVGVYGRMG